MNISNEHLFLKITTRTKYSQNQIKYGMNIYNENLTFRAFIDAKSRINSEQSSDFTISLFMDINAKLFRRSCEMLVLK